MEDVLMSAARTIVNQAERITTLENLVDELSARLDVLESDHMGTRDWVAHVEGHVAKEKNRNQKLADDIMTLLSEHQYSQWN